MKVFYSIFSIFLCILCILALFTYPQPDSYLFHDFSAKVLAKEIAPDTHQTLSDAHIFSRNQTYQVKLPAYNSFYGCISYYREIHFTITSNAIQNLKISLFTDIGKKLPCQTSFSKKTCTISPAKNSSIQSTRIFLCVTNQSSANCSLFIRVGQNTEKKILAKENKKKEEKKTKPKDFSIAKKSNPAENNNQTTKEPRQSNTTSNPKQNPPTPQIKKAILYPQFLLLTPSSKYKLSIKKGQRNCKLSDYTILSSNPSIASVKHGKVLAHREGTAILYISDKRNSAMTSSCYLRILYT